MVPKDWGRSQFRRDLEAQILRSARWAQGKLGPSRKRIRSEITWTNSSSFRRKLGIRCARADCDVVLIVAVFAWELGLFDDTLSGCKNEDIPARSFRVKSKR